MTIDDEPTRHASTHDCVVAENLSKRFGSTIALQDASFSIPDQHFTALLGPSGCGKSTLLRLVAGLIPFEGELSLHGTPVEGPRADVGMMFQRPTLLPWRSAVENVLLPTVIGEKRTSPDDHDKAIHYLQLVGLHGFEFTYPKHMSGGMQQRVSLARLLMTGADILLLDEPFGALDEFTRERLNLELLRVHREVGATTLFVTHNINEAVFLADEILVMTPGPGKLAGVVQVPFERPREIDLMRTKEFTDIVFEVREVLGGSI